jgi:hypothetical protein
MQNSQAESTYAAVLVIKYKTGGGDLYDQFVRLQCRPTDQWEVGYPNPGMVSIENQEKLPNPWSCKWKVLYWHNLTFANHLTSWPWYWQYESAVCMMLLIAAVPHCVRNCCFADHWCWSLYTRFCFVTNVCSLNYFCNVNDKQVHNIIHI